MVQAAGEPERAPGIKALAGEGHMGFPTLAVRGADVLYGARSLHSISLSRPISSECSST
jgi:hypothetical protein